MKINSTANFSQILQQVPHTGTSGFEPQLVTHEKICTSLENDQCSNTEHQTKPFMHTSWNQAISAAPLCTNRASVCLSVSVSHRTLDCYCWMVLYLFDFCGFHVVSCGMQEVWRYFKGHTRKCAGCIIRIKLFWGKVILTYGHRSGCDWSDLCMKWMSGFHCHWIGLMLKEKKTLLEIALHS